jgi:L-galactose dehydrogenase
MGLGCGGHSRLGLARGGTTDEAARVVRAAIDLGVNFIDTAESYGTEEAVGLAVSRLPRESIVLSTKVGVSFGGPFLSPTEIRERVEGCLRRLRTDYIDVFHLHGVMPSEYPHALQVLYPALVQLKAEGKIRHIGITEAFIRDPGHQMLSPAVQDGPWEVVMVGFSLLNPSARVRVLHHTMHRGIGTLCMFAVRRALSQRDVLLTLIETLVEDGHESVAPLRDGALDFLAEPGVAKSVQEAAYRFCLWEPGIDIVLSGTGNVEHLRENAQALQGPPLPSEALVRLDKAFGAIDSVSGN